MQQPKVSTASGVLFPKPFLGTLCEDLGGFVLQNQILVLKEFFVTLVSGHSRAGICPYGQTV